MTSARGLSAIGIKCVGSDSEKLGLMAKTVSGKTAVFAAVGRYENVLPVYEASLEFPDERLNAFARFWKDQPPGKSRQFPARTEPRPGVVQS
jgi:hypothetical protein